MKKGWFISDTHRKHGLLKVPENIDFVFHGGDESNNKSPYFNVNECLDFLTWYSSLDIKYKIFVAGNHSTAIGEGLIKRSDIPENIIYLEHESVEIEGIKIFGSPYTPEFSTGWSFNVPRKNLKSYWDEVPDNTDILITHGPPKGILDLTQYDTRAGANGESVFQCGCKDLLDAVKRIQPKYHMFGHIHPEKNCPNAGQQIIQHCKTTFINAAVVDLDYEIHNNGIVVDI